MDELADRFQFGVAGDFLLEKIFDGFHVVVGAAFDSLDPLGVGGTEVFQQPFKRLNGACAQRWRFRDLRMAGQGLQPAHLHQHPVADQAVLTENRP